MSEKQYVKIEYEALQTLVDEINDLKRRTNEMSPYRIFLSVDDINNISETASPATRFDYCEEYKSYLGNKYVNVQIKDVSTLVSFINFTFASFLSTPSLINDFKVYLFSKKDSTLHSVSGLQFDSNQKNFSVSKVLKGFICPDNKTLRHITIELNALYPYIYGPVIDLEKISRYPSIPDASLSDNSTYALKNGTLEKIANAGYDILSDVSSSSTLMLEDDIKIMESPFDPSADQDVNEF